MHAYRSHTCGELRPAHAGETVRLSGWVHRKRDHGGLLFVDLRDHYGITQLVSWPGEEGFEILNRLRAECVVRIDGKVVERTPDTVNPELPTGEIEVRVSSAELLSEAAELPVPVFGEPDYPEELRLTYRYLDLRRETLHKHIVLRSQVIASIRKRMIEQGFTEYQTPILTASSPEGARGTLRWRAGPSKEEPMRMSVGVLDHYNVSTRRLSDTVRFYEDVLGLVNGPRPPFDFPGAWLYSEGHPVLHVNDISATDRQQCPDSGVIDHVAFGSRGFEEMKQHLLAAGLITRKLPEQLEVVDALPRNPSGKIVKFELQKRFAGG